MRNFNCELIGKVVFLEEEPDSIELYLLISRAEGKEDILPVMVPRDIATCDIKEDDVIKIKGIIRTLKAHGRSILRVQAVDFEEQDKDQEHKNKVFGRFYVKSSKSVRTTSSGYRVKDLMLRRKVSDDLGYSEFRAVVWNEDADKYGNIPDNTDLYIVGRLQCREYSKKTEDGSKRVRTYEVSVGKVEDDTDKYAEEV